MPGPSIRLSVALCVALAFHAAVFAGFATRMQSSAATAVPISTTVQITLAYPAAPSVTKTAASPATPPAPPTVQPATAPTVMRRHVVARHSVVPPMPHPRPIRHVRPPSLPADTPPNPNLNHIVDMGSGAPTTHPVEDVAPPAPVVAAEVISHPVAYRDNPRPIYPMVARRQGLAGTVRLAVVVDVTGVPIQIRVKDSSGYSMLDEAARNAVERWHFEPARRAGQALIATVEVPVRFQLADPSD